MTKGQAARALANAIGELVTVDVELRNLFQEVGLRWNDFEGAASSRLFQAICIATRDQVTLLVESPAQRYSHSRDELQQLLRDYLALPGVVWDERVAGDYDKTCPYPGMRSFTSPKGFYGREELTARLRKEIDATPLTLVTGTSGSGKSSVVMAGVFPLWKHDYSDHSTLIIRPEGNPFESIYVALCPVVGQDKAAPFRQPSEKAFSQLALLLIAEGIEHPLIFIDPLEKIFVAESDAAKQLRDQFAAALAEFASHNTTATRVVLGMRDDFLGALSQFPDLCRHTDAHLIRVFPMDADSLRTAVLRPAADHGVTLEDEIVQDIINRVLGRPGMLPLMQDVLSQLWKVEEANSLFQSRKLTFEQYLTLGGVMGSLTKRLDALCRQKGEATLRRIFLRTIRVAGDETTPAISRRGHRSELADTDEPILEELITGKVLVGYDPAPGQTEGTFGLPHEAVIQNWDKLRGWISDLRHVLTLVSRLAEDVAERDHRLQDHPEQRDSIDSSLLWRGGRLEDLTKLEASDCERLGFTEKMRGFLEASRKQRQEEQDRELRLAKEKAEAARRLQSANDQNLKQLHTASMAEHAAARKAWLENDDAVREHRWAPSIGKASKWHEAVAHWESSLALEPNNDLARYGLYDTLVLNGHANSNSALFEIKHEDDVKSASYSPDGTLIVTASKDKTAQVRDAATGAPLGPPLRHEDSVYGASFSPDGTLIVTASEDKTARVWDAATGAPVGQPLRHELGVYSASFGPDGRRVVTASQDGTARVWNAATGAPLGPPLRHEDSVCGASFSPDGTLIVTASLDETARVWDAATGAPVGQPLRHERDVYSASFSPDGTLIVTASKDKTARVWDAATGAPVGQPLRHEQEVNSASFSPDGTRIVTASDDQTARVWNAYMGNSYTPPLRHSHYVRSASFSPDGTRVVTASWDKTARVWDAATGALLGPPLRHSHYVSSASFSPDGTRVVTASWDNTAQVWDTTIVASVGLPLRHVVDVYSASFSLDSTLIVTASQDCTARVWDAATGASVGLPLRHEVGVHTACFSPDGTLIVTASHDGTARVWVAATGASVGQPLRPDEPVTHVGFSPDGAQVITASWDMTARVWDIATGAPVGQPLRHELGVVHSARYSPDGTLIVTASDDQTARVWDAATSAPVGQPLRHEGVVHSACFSFDGTRVITASWDNTVRVWDTATGVPVGQPLRYEKSTITLSLSPDCTRFFTARNDHTSQVWNSTSGAPLGQPLRHERDVHSASFSPDGARIVFTIRYGIAVVQDIPPNLVDSIGSTNEEREVTLKWISGIAGLRFNKDSGELEAIPDQEREKLSNVALPPGRWNRLAKWLKTKGPDRTITPTSNVTLRQIAERERDFGPLNIGTEESLESALEYDFTIPLARMMLAKLLVDADEVGDRENSRAHAAFWRQYDLDRLEPLKDAKLWQRAADILRQSPPDAPVGIGQRAMTVAKAIEMAERRARYLEAKATQPNLSESTIATGLVASFVGNPRDSHVGRA